MIPRFFIDRPIAANVIAWITILLGLVSVYKLPVEQYPAITPPTVVVNTNYPGASAKIVGETVASPIEEQINGVEGMLYMSSTCGSDGSYALTVTFDIGTNLDTAQVLVQNRVSAAESQLPEEVRRQGVTVKKQSTSIVLAAFLTSPDRRYDSLFLSNYGTLHVRNELSRVEGVGDVVIRGTGAYSMRIWLDPEKLLARGITTPDVQAALAEQNVQVAAGQLGQQPAPASQGFQMTVTTQGRLSDPNEFKRIVIKTDDAGRVVYLRDVARVELGAQDYNQFTTKEGSPAAGVIIYQLPGANSLEVGKRVKAALADISTSFPPGLTYTIPFDTTKFVDSAVREVYHTIFEAGFLVLIVILVFLHSWRAVLVPMTTVPVTLIGAFAFMQWLGFTINLLTLFGLVLAIGIVVDDAIVIVENAMHHIERGETPREGTAKAMDEVTGPVIGITAVLMAVFLPTLFMSGITGQLYRQFALTIAATAFISAINALTLKPAQCAAWLRPHTGSNLFGRVFDRVFGWFQTAYVWFLGFFLRHLFFTSLVFIGLTAYTGWLYMTLPTGFLPEEDQGYVLINIQLPDAASVTRTVELTKQVDAILKNTPGVDGWFMLGGFSFVDGAAAPNSATSFVTFKDWDQRTSPEETIQGIVKHLNAEFGKLQDAVIFTIIPPAIRGLGVGGGFQMQIEDRGAVGAIALQQATQNLVTEAQTMPDVMRPNTTFRAGVPQYVIDIDRERIKMMGVKLSDVFFTLQSTLGSAYVNDFNKFGRTYQVRMQADERFRMRQDDVQRLYIRNSRAQMVPLGSVISVRKTFGPQTISRYNLYSTASITGQAAAGFSSGQTLATMETLARRILPREVGFEWTSMAYQEKKVGGEAIGIFALAVLLVYLVLAFLYESWILPLTVILVVPLGILGAALAVKLRGMDNNIYTQVGVVLIIALACKNAILIVEFARELRDGGKSIREAALESARQRFRPILMTSFAFILGVLPLVHAFGAAAASRQALGTAVFGGMITSTVLAVFFVPPIYVLFQSLSEWIAGPKSE